MKSKNREIKFRVWTGTQMEYNVVVGQLGAFYAKTDPNDSACLNPTTKYYPETPVMQFTGLFDKNNKEIYEGDIVKTYFQGLEGEKFHELRKQKVEWLYKGWNIGENGWTIGVYVYEIIGNIFENPELLK